MFASQVTSQVVFEDGAVNIRKLSARSLEKASQQRQISVSQLTRSFGPEMIKAFGTDESKPQRQLTEDERRNARYSLYDRTSVIQAGVVSWTYSTKLSEGLDDLDEDASRKLHEAILDLSLPPLDPESEKEAYTKD